MKLAILQAILVAIGAFSLASIGAIILFINPPLQSSTVNFFVPVLLSLFIFLLLASTLTFFGIFLRRSIITVKNKKAVLTMAFREGSLLAGLLVLYMWLSRFNFLNIGTLVVALGFILAIEYYFLLRYARTR